MQLTGIYWMQSEKTKPWLSTVQHLYLYYTWLLLLMKNALISQNMVGLAVEKYGWEMDGSHIFSESKSHVIIC